MGGGEIDGDSSIEEGEKGKLGLLTLLAHDTIVELILERERLYDLHFPLLHLLNTVYII